MEFKTDNSYVKSVKCADVYTESQTDFTLPDYLGDVRKILFTEASLRPTGRFAGGDEVEFSGIVVYNVIYLDSQGGLCSVEFTSDYDYSVKCSGDNYNDSIADTRVSGCSIRLTGPRKINAKASLVGSVRLSEEGFVGATGDAFLGEISPEINKGSVPVRVSRASSVCEREYAESLARLEGAIADEVKVVHTVSECLVDEVRADDEKALIKGRLRLYGVVANGDEPAYGVEKTVGFEEMIDFEGLEKDMQLLPQVLVTSLKSDINADESGCEVVLSAILEFCVIGEGNQTVDLVLDGYLTDCDTDNSYDKFDYTTLVDVASAAMTHNAEIDRSELESENLREIVFLSSTPKIERVEHDGDSVNIIGEIRYSGIASETHGDKTSYIGLKFSSPFTSNVNINCQNSQNLDFEAEVHTYNTNATVDSEKLYAACSLESRVVVTCDQSKTVLSSMTRVDCDSEAGKEAVVTVYYPDSNETLFDVAKRFRTSCAKVAKDNDISESVFAGENSSATLTGVKKLIIY